jgi:hypothetical protein
VSTGEELRGCGDRIERLLDQLSGLPDPRAGPLSEELLREVTDLYGAGLERAIELACEPGAPLGAALLEAMSRDELLSALLVLHGIHPRGLRVRLEEALEVLRPSLGSADVSLLACDEAAGTARVRVLVDGGPDAVEAMRSRVRRTLEATLPDLVALDVDGPGSVLSTPVALGRKVAAR